MAVVGLAKEIVSARKKTEGEDGSRSYQRKYLVKCDDVEDDQSVALSAAGLPQRYMHYSTTTSQDTAAKCVEREATQVDGSYLLWHVDIRYTTAHGDQQNEQQEQDNPLSRLPEIEFSFETLQVPIWYYPNQTVASSTAPGHDFDGPIVSSAGEVYDPPPTVDESRPVVTITRNEASYNPAIAIAYQNAVNSDWFFGAPPRCAKVRSISARSNVEKDLFYWIVTYVIAFRRETWDVRLLNYGSWELTAAGATTTKPLKHADGSLRYGLLRSDGTALPVNFSSSDVRYMHYKTCVQKSFAALNLPFSPNRS